MRSTGIIMRIDGLGRVVIPKDVQRIAGLRAFDPIEIYVSYNGEVLLKKYSPYDEATNSQIEKEKE